MFIARKVHRFVEHPYTKLTLGLLLVYTGVSEVVEKFAEDAADRKLGVHHAVVVLGIFQILRILPDILEGVGDVAEYFENRVGKPLQKRYSRSDLSRD